jgi:hypothetical protein
VCVSKYLSVLVCVHVSLCMCMPVCVCVSMCVCIYVCMCVYVCSTEARVVPAMESTTARGLYFSTACLPLSRGEASKDTWHTMDFEEVGEEGRGRGSY